MTYKDDSKYNPWLFRLTDLSRNTEELDDFKMHPKGNNTCQPTDVPVYLTGIFVSLSVTGILTSALGNSLVFLAVYKTYALRTPANCLLVSLSLASLLFIPVLASYTVALTKKDCDPIKPELCKWTAKVDFALFCVFMGHLLIISLDRLVAIKRPMRYVMESNLWSDEVRGAEGRSMYFISAPEPPLPTSYWRPSCRIPCTSESGCVTVNFKFVKLNLVKAMGKQTFKLY